MQKLGALSLVLGLLGCGGGGGGPVIDSGAPDPIFSEPRNLVTVVESTYRGEQVNIWSSGRAVFATDPEDFLDETMREGNCRLLESDAPGYCENCPTGFCVGGECQAWPTYRSAGRITLTGLATALTLSWQQGYYNPDQFQLPADLFGPGDSVTATAPGAEVDGFTVTAAGVAPIEPDLEGSCASELRLTDGQDAVLSWPDPAGDDARVRLWMPSRNNGHGLPPNAVIECEGPDTGSLRIAAALVDAFPPMPQGDTCSGIACVSIDCPPSTLARYGSGTAVAGSEEVELRVQSEVNFALVDAQ